MGKQLELYQERPRTKTTHNAAEHIQGAEPTKKARPKTKYFDRRARFAILFYIMMKPGVDQRIQFLAYPAHSTRPGRHQNETGSFNAPWHGGPGFSLCELREIRPVCKATGAYASVQLPGFFLKIGRSTPNLQLLDRASCGRNSRIRPAQVYITLEAVARASDRGTGRMRRV